MLKEAEIFSNVLIHGDGPVQLCDLGITSTNFSASDPSKRPGWNTVLAKRVRARQRSDRDRGISEDKIVQAYNVYKHDVCTRLITIRT
jgi:hypothetical protein